MLSGGCFLRKTQRSVIREASFHLSALLGGHQDAITISGMDRNQILEKGCPTTDKRTRVSCASGKVVRYRSSDP